MTFAWTDQAVKELKRLLLQGQPTSAIARALGVPTRNAVIGKIHRLGLAGRVKRGLKPVPTLWTAERLEELRDGIAAGLTIAAIAQQLGTSEARAQRMARKHGLVPKPRPVRQMRPRLADRIAAAIADDPTPENVIPFGPRCTLLELTSATCRFPIGDPRAADFAFCGARPVPGVPYCIHHARIAYTPAIARRREPLAKASGLTLRCGGSRSAGWP